MNKMMSYITLKRFMPRSLLLRSFLILAIPIFLIQLISTYVFFDRHWHRMTDRLAYGVAGEIAMIAEQIVITPTEDQAEVLRGIALQHLDVDVSYKPKAEIDFFEEEYESWGNVVSRTLSKALDEKIALPYQIDLQIEKKTATVHVQIESGVVSFLIPRNRLFSSSGYAFLFWMIGVSFSLLLIAMLFMRNQIRPIKRLAVAADRFGKGREAPFLKIEGAREVRQAAQAFIDMRARIDKQIQQRTTMLAGVSHDLRTPLTRMKLQAEMLGDNDDAQHLKNDIDDMERMITAYLQFAKGDGDESVELVNLVDVIERIIATAERDGSIVNFEKNDGDFSLFLRPVAFERCLGNIVSNAQKYAEECWISINRDDKYITINIDDNGAGIAEENYQDVFKPFFREEKSRNSKTGGVGLGLPIAQDVILSHGGDISLDKSPQGGLRVVVRLPL